MSAAVTLEQMLAARDARAAGQARLAARFDLTDDPTDGAIVSVTLVTPGPDKNPPWAPEVFAAAMTAVQDDLPLVSHAELHESPAGPHGLVVVSGLDAHSVKRHTVRIEESHRWGRLVDLDVVVAGVPLSRTEIGAPPRRCLVCDGPAAPCARSRAHDLPALQDAIEELLCT